MKRVLFYGNSDTAWSQWLKNKDKTLLFKRKGSDVNFQFSDNQQTIFIVTFFPFQPQQ